MLIRISSEILIYCISCYQSLNVQQQRDWTDTQVRLRRGESNCKAGKARDLADPARLVPLEQGEQNSGGIMVQPQPSDCQASPQR